MNPYIAAAVAEMDKVSVSRFEHPGSWAMDPTSCRFLAAFTRALGAKRVLEFGSGFDLAAMKGEEALDISQCPVSPENLAKLLTLIDAGTISGKIAKTVFEEMMLSGQDPETVVKEKGLVQMSDQGEIMTIVREIIAANPEQAQQFQEGKTKVMGFFVGQLMKQTGGKANPGLANELFVKALTK